ncbi:MAG: FAD-binding protein, partial [Elusimicrobiota bacterium]
LIAAGVRFTEKERGLDLGLEGGHSRRRILHAGDLTGREIERALAQACREDPRIRIFEDHAAVDLILKDDPASTAPGRNRCWGAWVLDARTGEVKTFRAKAVLLATGGAGRVYLYTSNPDIATGAGMSMAYRAGARLANLEFVQFHPTCLYNPASRTEEDRRFLLSEALRGEGGVLLRKDGTRLMEDAHPLKDLAPRDIVARAIDAEMKRSGAECVFLDMRARPRAFLRKRFPNIFSHCLQAGFDMARSPIPVVPAAHFFCGGVETGPDADTDIPGLHAVGETAHTGLHGANRLASNSLLEAVVFAHRVFERYRREDGWRRVRPPRVDAWRHPPPSPAQEAVLIRQDWGEIRRLMWNYVGIVRSDRRLESALERIRVIRQEVLAVYRGFPLSRDLVELRSIALLSELIIRSALRRKE